MKRSHFLAAAIAGAFSLPVSAPIASAAEPVDTYLARAYTSSITSASWTTGRAGTPNSGFVQLNSGGTITFSVYTSVKEFWLLTRSSNSCAPGSRGGAAAGFEYRVRPSYWQQSGLFAGTEGYPGFIAAPTAWTTYSSGSYVLVRYPGGWSASRPDFNPDPTKITVRFVNDYRDSTCDRNLQIHALKVVA